MIYTLLGIRDHRAAVDRPFRVAFKDFPAALRGTATCHPAANLADGASSAGPNLWKVTPFAHAMLLGDRKTPALAIQPVWRSHQTLRLVRLVENYLARTGKAT